MPFWQAGQRVTAGKLLSTIPMILPKTTATARASTAALADDPDLKIALTDAGTYIVEMTLLYGAITASGFQTSWNVAGAVTSSGRSCIGPGSSAASTDNIGMHWGQHAYATAVSYGGRNSASALTIVQESGLVTTTGAVTITLRWAQGTSNASATTLSDQSWARVTRLT